MASLYSGTCVLFGQAHVFVLFAAHCILYLSPQSLALKKNQANVLGSAAWRVDGVDGKYLGSSHCLSDLRLPMWFMITLNSKWTGNGLNDERVLSENCAFHMLIVTFDYKEKHVAWKNCLFLFTEKMSYSFLAETLQRWSLSLSGG